MVGKDFAGMRRYQPEKNQRPERNKSVSPKKRVESNDWIDASRRPRHVPVLRSPVKTLPTSPTRETIDRTKKWVEDHVLVSVAEQQNALRGQKRRADDRRQDTEDGDEVEQVNKDPLKTVVAEKPSKGIINVPEPSSSGLGKSLKEATLGKFEKTVMNPRPAGLDENEERWIYWRILDWKIDAVLEKHGRFQGKYLSHQILTQVFSPPDVPEDSGRDFQQITLEVTNKPPIFQYGSRGKRLTISTRVYPTDKSAKDVRKTLVVAMNGSLALFMDQVLKEEDLLTVIRESGPSFSDLIVLNAKFLGNNTTRIVHFRPKLLPKETEVYDNLKGGYFKVEEELKETSRGCEGRIMVRPVRPEDAVSYQDQDKQQASDKEGHVSASVQADKMIQDPAIAVNSEKSSDSKSTAFTTSQQSSKHSDGHHPDVFEQSVTQRTQSDSDPVKNNIVVSKDADGIEEENENSEHPNSAEAQTNAETKEKESENSNESPEVLQPPKASKRKQIPTKSCGKNVPYNTQQLNACLFTQETHDQILEDLCKETQPFIVDHLFADDSPPSPPVAPATSASRSPATTPTEKSKVNRSALKEKASSMQLDTQYFPLDCLDSQIAYDGDSSQDCSHDLFEDSEDDHSDHSSLIAENDISEKSQAACNQEGSDNPSRSSCTVA